MPVQKTCKFVLHIKCSSVIAHFRRNLARRHHCRQYYQRIPESIIVIQLNQTFSEVRIEAQRVINIALRHSNPRHDNFAPRFGAIDDIKAKWPRSKQLFEGAHVNCGVHGIGHRCLLAILRWYIDYNLTSVEAFGTKKLQRILTAVLEGLRIPQLLP